jgi:lysyl-tRNA synthetase, class II
VAIEAVLSAATPDDPSRRRLIGRLAPPVLPSLAQLLAVIAGLGLLVLTPKLWRGTRTAVPLAIAGLGALAVLNMVKGLDYEDAALELCLAALLALGRGAFPLGCRNRPRLTVVCTAVGAWALTYCAVLVGPAASDRGHTIRQALHTTLGHPRSTGTWAGVIEVLIVCAVAVSLLAVRSLLRPAVGPNGHHEDEYRAARAIVERYGEDSLSPFILRPDKAFHITVDGVLAYRVIGETAVISGDPVAAARAAPRVLASFLELARERGWQIAVWGASARHLDAYRGLRMRAVCVGEEAFVDPEQFTLEGRRVRKLRQSVHRVQRRGWEVTAYEGRELDARLESEIEALESAWRASRRRILGFAMAMGAWDPEPRPDDLYLLGRSPDGELRAVMRFVEHRGRLSLDTMHRVGETPNGLNEALVCQALEAARARGVPEVSLNYAGLAHLVRGTAGRGPASRRFTRVLMGVLGRRFQMSRLVQFDDKFFPEWRQRFLVYEARAALPRAVLRVLQAEGYLPQARAPRLPVRWQPIPRSLPRTDAAS